MRDTRTRILLRIEEVRLARDWKAVPWQALQHFDAFGVRVATTLGWGGDEDASRYRWRSQEGSETDDLAVSDNYAVGLQPPTLVYMQTRHYDPSLGRFIMADSIPMGANSPQGLNRYSYCLNDPVNMSDPEGAGVHLLVAFILAMLAIAASFLIKSLLKKLVKRGILCWLLGQLGSSALV